MSWFRVEADLVDHPKIFRLAEILGSQCAGWYYIRLLAWTSRYAARGRLRDVTLHAIEDACGWRGESGALLRAFVVVGLVDELENQADGATLEVHDWWEVQRQYVVKAEKDAERKRRERTRHASVTRTVHRTSRGQSTGCHADSPQDVPRDGAGTIRDETRREEEREKKISGASAPTSNSPHFSPPKAQKREKEPTDSRHTPLVRALVAAGATFDGGKDAAHVSALLRIATGLVGVSAAAEEVVARWRRAQEHVGYPTVRSLQELRTHWGHFAPSQSEQNAARMPRCVVCGAAAPTGWPELGVPTCHTHAIEAASWADERGLVVYQPGGADVWLAGRAK